MRPVAWIAVALFAPAMMADSIVAGPDGIRVDTPGIKVTGETSIEGGERLGPARERKPAGGGIEFTSVYADRETGRRTTVVERLQLKQTSVRGEVEVLGDGAPWTRQIVTRLRYPASAGTRFWTAWSDPNGDSPALTKKPLAKWSDPLRAMPLAERRFWYGGPPYTYDDPFVGFCPLYGDLLSIALATFVEPQSDRGLSLAVSPEDDMLDLSLAEHTDGTIEFARRYHRIAADRAVRFAMDLVPHEGDWRGGLRWMRNRYPGYFEPAIAGANNLSGTGAYSALEVPFDADKMRRMAFSVNWKASFDFPYMGMFLPPAGAEPWHRYGGDSAGNMPPGKAGSRGEATIAGMEQYSANMRKLGFHVLNYFNVTEFGANIEYPPPARHNESAADLWKDANDFLYGRLRDAILYVPDRAHGSKLKPGEPYFTWGNGVIMDSGEPAYRDFLLEQARRHIEKLPDSDGICIDRMDWLRMYNERRDDGIAWFNDHAARSLVTSWRKMMDRLLPLMHDAGKVVFVNNHDKRLDTLLGIDGIFDEFTYNGAALNTTGLLAVARPASGWTSDESQIRPDPDGFFQRFLYMGVFPMAPFPGNDHSLAPSEWVDRQYLDYGPLMRAMQGRNWVLEPHAVEVPGGDAIANLFTVPGAWVAPVVFGGTKAKVTLRLRLGDVSGAVTMDALHPGSDRPVSVPYRKQGMVWQANVPLVRGCAMLRIRR
jgi:hypothetical protein